MLASSTANSSAVSQAGTDVSVSLARMGLRKPPLAASALPCLGSHWTLSITCFLQPMEHPSHSPWPHSPCLLTTVKPRGNTSVSILRYSLLNQPPLTPAPLTSRSHLAYCWDYQNRIFPSSTITSYRLQHSRQRKLSKLTEPYHCYTQSPAVAPI